MKNYIVSLDQGTTSSRCIIYNRDGEVIARSQTEITQIYPQKGWVEHDPMEIWATQIGVLNEALARENISPEDIDSIGITNQRETTIIWDKKTGRPIYNAIVWQCRRTADYCEVLKRTPMESVIREKTGLVIDAYFSASKIRWILDHIPGAQERAERGEILFGTVDSWLLFQLTKGKVHATDYTNASRTMLFNIKTLEWDQELLALFNIPRAMLPDTYESSHLFGETSIQGVRLPITAMVGDQQASIFGQQCFDKGDVKTTYGTGCFVLMNTHDHFVVSNHGLLTTITMAYNGKISYGLEGSVFNAGSVIQWLRDGLGLVDEAKDIEYFATKVPHNGGVVFVPALTGLGAPYRDMDATGALYGLTRGTNKNHILRAALESIALQCYDIIKAMEHDSQVEIKSLRVDGGASENHTLMQWQADLLNVQVQKGKHAESTALGACYLAGLKTGFFPSVEVIQEQHEWRFCWEREADQTTVNNLLTLWQAAIAKTLTKPES